MHPATSRARMELARLLRIDPFDHQCTAFARGMQLLEQHSSYGLWHEMGCGKTLTVLGLFLQLADRGDIDTMLVVCPKSVISAWQREVSERNLPIEVLTLDHTGVARREAVLQRRMLERDQAKAGMGGLKPLPMIVVVNYESTWRMEQVIRACRFGMVTCDESQRIKAPGSKQSKAMARIGSSAQYRVAMSGTPNPESELDHYAQFRFLDDRVFGTSFEAFKAKYANTVMVGPEGKQFPKVTVKPEMLPELERVVHSRSHRVTKHEALQGVHALPPALDANDVEFMLAPKVQKIYNELVRESIAFIEDELGEIGEVLGANVLTRMLRLQQLCGDYMKLEGEDTVREVCKPNEGKRGVYRDLLEDLLADPDRKVIVFHNYLAEGQAIRRIAAEVVGSAKHPIEQPYIDGSVSAKDRAEAQRRFRDDPAQRVIVGQIAAMAEGVTLNQADSTIYYSTGASGAKYEQSRARNDRIGQTKPVTYFHLVARMPNGKTVDQTIREALAGKRMMADEFTNGGWRRYLEGTV